MLDRIHERELDANVSVKLTAMGLDIDRGALRRDHAGHPRPGASSTAPSCASTWRRSAVHGASRSTLFDERLYPNYTANVGIVLQSYLLPHLRRRRARERAQAACASARARTRSRRPSRIRTRRTSTRTTCSACSAAHDRRNYPGIATHDDRRSSTRRSAARRSRRSRRTGSSSRCSTACAATCRSSSCARATACACTCRSARSGIPYLMRRLAERPANVAFITGNVLRESAPAPTLTRRAECPVSISPPITVEWRRQHDRRLRGGAWAAGGIRGRGRAAPTASRS